MVTCANPNSLTVIIVVAILTTWCGHVVGTFKRNHPEVYAMDGVGYVLAGTAACPPIFSLLISPFCVGKWGREIFSFTYPLFMIFLCGSGYITLSIAFNAITDHATCTVVWAVIVSAPIHEILHIPRLTINYC